MQIYIFGSGVMATAMAKILSKNYEIIIVSRDLKKLEKFKDFGCKTEIYTQNYNIQNKNIILAFKPFALDSVAKFCSGEANFIISILAKTSLDKLKLSFKSKNYCIAMPNIALKFGSSVTPFFCDENKEIFQEILLNFGEIVEVNSQKEFDIAGILSGCGPAFMALIAESLVKGGVNLGLNYKICENLVANLLKSSGEILKNQNPYEAICSICTPCGTTIEGIFELEKAGICNAFMQALKSSFEKQIN